MLCYVMLCHVHIMYVYNIHMNKVHKNRRTSQKEKINLRSFGQMISGKLNSPTWISLKFSGFRFFDYLFGVRSM